MAALNFLIISYSLQNESSGFHDLVSKTAYSSQARVLDSSFQATKISADISAGSEPFLTASLRHQADTSAKTSRPERGSRARLTALTT